MKRLTLALSFLLLILTFPALARTKVDVSSFENQAKAGPCNAVAPWKAGIDEAFRYQLINALNASSNFTVVEPELMRGEQRAKLFDSGVSTIHRSATFKAAQYSIFASLKTFDICDKNAEVILDIRVIENKSGSQVHQFQSRGVATNKKTTHDYKGASFNTGLFKDSPIGQATTAAVADVTARLKKIFPDRDVASDDYKIRTIPRSRRR